MQLKFEIHDTFNDFLRRCQSRLVKGAEEYGNKSFSLDSIAVISEIEEELMDVCNWSFILFMRLQQMKVALTGVDESQMEDWPGETDLS